MTRLSSAWFLSLPGPDAARRVRGPKDAVARPAANELPIVVLRARRRPKGSAGVMLTSVKRLSVCSVTLIKRYVVLVWVEQRRGVGASKSACPPTDHHHAGSILTVATADASSE